MNILLDSSMAHQFYVYISFRSFLHRRCGCLYQGMGWTCARQKQCVNTKQLFSLVRSFNFFSRFKYASVWFIRCVCAKIKKTPLNILFKWRIKSYSCIVMIITQWVWCESHNARCPSILHFASFDFNSRIFV